MQETAVRCHFGMAGSLYCISGQPHAKPNGKQLALLLRFDSSEELRVYDSSAVACDAQSARDVVRTSHIRDVCSRTFDAEAAVSAVAGANAAWMISDVLLDQSFLPGVGNIIKNEALHRAATDPRQQMHALDRTALTRIVHEVRAFSDAWCRAARQPPCMVYNRTLCEGCGSPVSFCKLGDIGPARPTFWCIALCGSTSGKRKRHGDGQPVAATAAAPVHSNPWAAAAAASAAAGRSLAPSVTSAALQGAYDASSSSYESSAAPITAPPVVSCAALVAPPTAAPPAAAPPAAAPPAPMASSRPLCMLHGRRQLTLRRVRKAGPNEGRLFYACRGQGCELFEWADRGFPRCSCPGQPVAGLRVSKTKESGGRWFFGCRRDAMTRCSHFAWAPMDMAQQLGGLLNPLT